MYPNIFMERIDHFLMIVQAHCIYVLHGMILRFDLFQWQFHLNTNIPIYLVFAGLLLNCALLRYSYLFTSKWLSNPNEVKTYEWSL